MTTNLLGILGISFYILLGSYFFAETEYLLTVIMFAISLIYIRSVVIDNFENHFNLLYT